MFKNGLRYLISKYYRPLLELYLKKSRAFHYKNLNLIVHPGVFHPGYFFSSKVMLSFMDRLNLKHRTLLEIGSGSGILSLYATQLGAQVTACDISQNAINNCKENQHLNKLNFALYLSDLFSDLPIQTFDFILINPPYYKKKVTTEAEYAWFCGENGEYFQKLFSQVNSYIHENSKVYLVVFDGIDLNMLEAMAATNDFKLEKAFTKKNWLETSIVLSVIQNG